MHIPPGPQFEPSALGGVALTGWIGLSPQDGGDFAYLLLYTTGGGDLGPDAAQAGMAALLAAHGLRAGTMLRGPDQLAGVTVRLSLTGQQARLRLGQVTADVQISRQWRQVALSRGEVLLTVTTRPYRLGRLTLEGIDAFMTDPQTLAASALVFLPVGITRPQTPTLR